MVSTRSLYCVKGAHQNSAPRRTMTGEHSMPMICPTLTSPGLSPILSRHPLPVSLADSSISAQQNVALVAHADDAVGNAAEDERVTDAELEAPLPGCVDDATGWRSVSFVNPQ